MKKNIIILSAVILLAITGIITAILLKGTEPKKSSPKPTEPKNYEERTYNLNLIKTINSSQTDNYLISPYSIEIALNMLKEGASHNSKEEIKQVIPNRTIPNISIKNRIGIANATFIKEEYQEYIEKDFIKTLQDKYQAEVITDKFETPEKINQWASDKTNKMIDKVVNDISKEFVLGIANALAIDVDWQSSFECINTTKEEFKKSDNTKMNTEMMHKTYKAGANYFETDLAEGVIIPYASYDKDGEITTKGGNQLEFIGILPKEDINTYIEKLTKEELENIDIKKKEVSNDINLILGLPRFQYDFDLEEFQKVLETMGIKEVFQKEKADLTNIMTRENMAKIDAINLYVSKSVHKTHIELNEKGTKAAAVTYFGIDKANSIEQQEPEYKEITFNKPFAYIIRDSKTKELLFFGVVQEPNEWQKTTCENE